MNPQNWAHAKPVLGKGKKTGQVSQCRDDSRRGCRGSPARDARVAAERAQGDLRPSLRLGTRLLHYKLVEQLGAGSTGVVYRALDMHLKRFVALKVFSRVLALELSAQRRFIREAQYASSLSHPNIVTIHDIGYDKGHYFIVMEYVPGTTLTGIIARKNLSLESGLDYAIQIAAALANVHAAGILYRDLKPANILITPSGLVKLADFSLAKAIGAKRATGLDRDCTGEGSILGTVAYMSPEQVRGERLSPRTDIFSFGVTLYELITGERLFRRKTIADTIAAIIYDDPPNPSKRLPPTVAEIVRSCLQKEVRLRARSMRHVAAQLRAVRAGVRDLTTPTVLGMD